MATERIAPAKTDHPNVSPCYMAGFGDRFLGLRLDYGWLDQAEYIGHVQLLADAISGMSRVVRIAESAIPTDNQHEHDVTIPNARIGIELLSSIMAACARELKECAK